MKKRTNELRDVISKQSLNIIDIRDKEIMVAAMKRTIEDLNKIELLFAAMELEPGQLLQLRQFINNNKLRARKVIWGLVVSRIKDSKDKKYLEDVERKNIMMSTEEI